MSSHRKDPYRFGKVGHLASARVPTEDLLAGLPGYASTAWRIVKHNQPEAAMASSSPLEEYKCICEFMRLYATLRFYQLALLLGMTGGVVTALIAASARANHVALTMLKLGALLVSLALTVMEFRATSYWHRLRDRANELCGELQFQPFPVSSRWNPLTTGGAGVYLHVGVVALWLTSLVVKLQAIS